MEYQIEDKNTSHTLKLDDRKFLQVTGVRDVDGFDEHTIVLSTGYGVMTVHGSELHISKLNIEDGCLNIHGNVDSIQYSNTDVHEQGGWLSRLFK